MTKKVTIESKTDDHSAGYMRIFWRIKNFETLYDFTTPEFSILLGETKFDCIITLSKYLVQDRCRFLVEIRTAEEFEEKTIRCCCHIIGIENAETLDSPNMKSHDFLLKDQQLTKLEMNWDLKEIQKYLTDGDLSFLIKVILI